MEALLALLQENVREIAADCAAIRHNYAAMNAMADDVTAASERGQAGHREWSNFTGEAGRE